MVASRGAGGDDRSAAEADVSMEHTRADRDGGPQDPGLRAPEGQVTPPAADRLWQQVEALWGPRAPLGCGLLIAASPVLAALLAPMALALGRTASWSFVLAVVAMWPMGILAVVAAVVAFREAPRGSTAWRRRAVGLVMLVSGLILLVLPTYDMAARARSGRLPLPLLSPQPTVLPVPSPSNVPAAPPLARVTSILVDSGTGLVAFAVRHYLPPWERRVFVLDSKNGLSSELAPQEQFGAPELLLGWTGDSPLLFCTLDEVSPESNRPGLALVGPADGGISQWQPFDDWVRTGTAVDPQTLLIETRPGGAWSPPPSALTIYLRQHGLWERTPPARPGSAWNPHAGAVALLTLAGSRWEHTPLALPAGLQNPSVLWAGRRPGGLELLLECEEPADAPVRPPAMTVEGCRRTSVARATVSDGSIVCWTEVLPAEDRCRWFSAASDGSLLCALVRDDERGNLCLTYDLDGGAEPSATRVPEHAAELLCSPDGARIALVGPAVDRRDCRLWVFHVRSGEVKQFPLPAADGWVTAVAWLSAERLAVGVARRGLAELHTTTGEWRDLVRVPDEAAVDREREGGDGN
jgi:hypothetical protein